MSTSAQAAPKTITYLRILMAIIILRVLGILFIVADGQFPSYFSIPFGIGDTLTGLIAIILVFYLPKGGIRTYALTMAWNAAGLLDLSLAAGVSTLGGLYNMISAFFGPAIVLLPLDIVDHIVIFALLLTGSVSAYFARTRMT